MSDLDIASLVSKLDTEDMLGYLRNFPDDFAKQMDISQEKGRTPNSTLIQTILVVQFKSIPGVIMDYQTGLVKVIF